MYEEGGWQYKLHVAEYGHPSTNGFKDVIRVWKAERFDPDALVKFYKDNGAKSSWRWPTTTTTSIFTIRNINRGTPSRSGRKRI
jgi:hypothetical protein